MMLKSSTPLALRLSLLILLFVGFGLEVTAQQIHKPYFQLAGEGQKRFGVESAKIKYEYGSDAKGFEVVTFDHWGWREKKQINKTTTMWGNTSVLHTTNYMDGNYAMTYTEHATMCRAYAERDLCKSLQESSKAVQVLHGEEVFKLNGAIKRGKETILGKECIIYEYPKFSKKIWVWEGIVLRSVQTMMDYQIKLEATSIDTQVTFEDDDFATPEGIDVKGFPAPEE